VINFSILIIKNHTSCYKAPVAGSRRKTALIPNKFTRCAYNIQRHSLGINSLTLTGVMIPVCVSMLIFVHDYHPNSLELSVFCLLPSLLFVHTTNQRDIYSSCFSSVCLCLLKGMVINLHSLFVTFVVTVIKKLKSENVYICILCTLHISNVTQSLSYKIWTKLNKILPESLFPNPT
jgi:hypothetical protein